MKRGIPGGWATVAVVVILLLPLLLPEALLTIFIFIGLSTMVVSGLSLLMGFAGQVSLGQAAFYAIGAYTAALLARDLGVPPLVGLLVAPAATAGIAYVVGLPLLRLRGHYLAFATLAFQLITLSLLGEARDITGGDTGLAGIPALGVGPVQVQGAFKPIVFGYLAWGLALLSVLFNYHLVRSRPGRALRALASSEAGALAAGVPVARYKLQVFALSAAYAGLAGGVYAFYVSYIAPGSFPLVTSIEFLIMATVGGLGSVWGAVVGATLVTLVVQVLQSLGTLPGMPLRAPAVFSYAVYGLVLVGVMLLLPAGIVPALRSARWARWRRL
ncbi:MAG: branched-chain amino acid ABC transporter permease [Chloroflexi bacterium]|nr:branched-chain amino acid ABC transporter permease [Chloroflexota bacterium]MBV9596549.1 branched-chain amino acid ABC transporter permease [Chloroflexota bacterium]